MYVCKQNIVVCFLNNTIQEKLCISLYFEIFKPGARQPKASERLVSWNCFCPGSRYVCCVCACLPPGYQKPFT